MGKRLSVTNETSTGRNQIFHDNYNNKNMTRQEFIKEIQNNEYQKFHIKMINVIETPVSNSDKSTLNNLG